MKHNPFIFVITVVFLAAGLMAGCGLKAPPRLPKTPMPPGVTDLSAVLKNGDVLLTWHVPPVNRAENRIDRFVVYRSVTLPGECTGCPELFPALSDVSVAEKKPGDAVDYLDMALPKAIRLRYKVVGFTKTDQEGADSNIVEIRP